MTSRTATLNGRNENRHKGEQNARNTVLTPPWLVERIRHDVFAGAIDLDPATTPANPCGALRWVTPPQDGILASWAGDVFCNPPWGRTLGVWVDRAINADARVVMLLPARVETRWFQLAARRCTDLLLLHRRPDYRREDGSKHERGGILFASALFGFRVSLAPLRDLGVVLELAS